MHQEGENLCGLIMLSVSQLERWINQQCDVEALLQARRQPLRIWKACRPTGASTGPLNTPVHFHLPLFFVYQSSEQNLVREGAP